MAECWGGGPSSTTGQRWIIRGTSRMSGDDRASGVEEGSSKMELK